MDLSSAVNSLFSFLGRGSSLLSTQAFPNDSDYKQQLNDKVDSLFKLIVESEIKSSAKTDNFLTIVHDTLTFYRKHPFANYDDPGEKPSMWRWSAGRKWKTHVTEKILPYQHSLHEISANLFFSNKFIVGEHKELREYISEPAKLYISTPRLHLISLLALKHINPSEFRGEQTLPVVFRLYETQISDKVLTLSKNFLALYFTVLSLEKLEPQSHILKEIIPHLEEHINNSSFTCFWSEYVTNNPKSIVLFNLVDRIVQNYDLLHKNKQSLGTRSEHLLAEDFDYENISINDLNEFFIEIIEPRDFSDKRDEWTYTQNICDIRIYAELLQTKIC